MVGGVAGDRSWLGEESGCVIMVINVVLHYMHVVDSISGVCFWTT